MARWLLNQPDEARLLISGGLLCPVTPYHHRASHRGQIIRGVNGELA